MVIEKINLHFKKEMIDHMANHPFTAETKNHLFIAETTNHPFTKEMKNRISETNPIML